MTRGAGKGFVFVTEQAEEASQTLKVGLKLLILG